MRRVMMTMVVIGVVLSAWMAWASSGGPGVTADEALTKLTEGNSRFVAGASIQPHQDAARRQDTGTNGQHPFAVVLTCADSRVPPEVVFDQGLGDLFVVRVAGNVAATDEIGSIEYGAEHLGAPLVVVLGHTKCGAVTAVVKGEPVTENIGKLVAPIVPAVAGVRERFTSVDTDELISRSIEANVWQAIADMYAASPLLKKLSAEGKIKIVGALYDVDSGKTNMLGEHPTKELLLK